MYMKKYKAVITRAKFKSLKLPSEAKAIDVGTLEVFRAVQIRQYQQGELFSIFVGRTIRMDC